MESPARSPARDGFQLPAEWTPQAALWLAWPCEEALWQDSLSSAQAEFAALCRVLAPKVPLQVLIPDEAAEAAAAAALSGCGARFHRIPFGDIWLRDIAPLFVRRADGAVATVRFGFNGWGEKYVLPHDAEVAARIAEASGLPSYQFDWVLEGGAIEVDGQGTLLTTRQCLLNPNRNGPVDAALVERRLEEALGVERVLWLEEGLVNDHTDGHVDTIARFVAPGVVVCMRPSGDDDPNASVLEQIAHTLASLRDAGGRTLEVVRVPSPGRVVDPQGRVMPASSLNYVVSNGVVVVPTYGTRFDASAVEAIGALFPKHATIGVSAYAILSGGGAFHCITQQQPARGTP